MGVLAELEDMLSQHPAVSESAVVAIPDQRWGERPLALVVLKPDVTDSVMPQQLREHVARYAERA